MKHWLLRELNKECHRWVKLVTSSIFFDFFCDIAFKQAGQICLQNAFFLQKLHFIYFYVEFSTYFMGREIKQNRLSELSYKLCVIYIVGRTSWPYCTVETLCYTKRVCRALSKRLYVSYVVFVRKFRNLFLLKFGRSAAERLIIKF